MAILTKRALLRGGAILSLALLGAQGAHAQQILSTVSSELDLDGPSEGADRKVTTTAGQTVSTTYGGANSKAQTDYGVNKLFAKGNDTHKQTVNSAWLDSYTVGGAAGSMVDLSFTMTIDGMANPGLGTATHDAPNYNFQLYALRGDGWSYVGDESESFDVLSLKRTAADGTMRVINARDFNGVQNINANGTAAARTLYDAATDSYTSYAPNGTWTVLGPTFLQAYRSDGTPNGSPAFYATNAAARNARATVVANYAVLGWGRFCDVAGNECPSVVTAGTDVTVSFRLAAGATFSLAGTMFADDVYDGTIDFFNTAKMTGISVSQGGSLTSGSGSLVDLGNGQYGYAAALAGAVPEPSTWALLILGFGLTGGAMRRRAGTAARQRAALRFS